MATINITAAEIAAGLLEEGFGLGSNQFTFSIPTAGSTWPRYEAGSEPFTGYAVLNPAQAAAYRAALTSWDELIAPDFTEVPDNGGSRGELRVAFSKLDAATAGYAYSGNPQVPGGKVGDIWLADDYGGRSFARGTYEYEVLVHEIGHTLGLKHPFEAPALPAAYDSTRYTIMAYNEVTPGDLVSFTQSGGSIRANASFVTVASPMVLDIAAVQQRYGADTKTRAGNTVYTFTQGEAFVQSIYDAGGTDTIDLSNFTRASIIDLTPGGYSSLGIYTAEQQIADWIARFPSAASFIRQVYAQAEPFTFTDNLGIAFNTVIENALGGSGADRITGNDAANRLTGLRGDDVIDGGSGNDVIEGNEGNDVLTGGRGADLFTFADRGSGGADRITDFNAAEDLFDLGAEGGANTPRRLFTAVEAVGNDSLLTYAAGTVRVEGIAGLSLAEWNARVFADSPRIAAVASVTVAENTTASFYRPSASTGNPGAITFGLIGPDLSRFAIDPATGALRFVAAPDFEDASGRTSFTAGVVAFDPRGGSAQQTVTVTIADVNEAPAFAAPARAVSVAGNSPIASVLLTGGAVDPDAGAVITYSLTGADAAAFAVDAGTGAVTFRSSPDFATRSSYAFTLVATDQAGLAGSQAVSVTVTGAPPSFFLLVPAGAAASVQGSGTVFGTSGGTQAVTVLDTPGLISFDGSFNTGGDRILLAGAASRYTVLRSGATAQISDGDTTVVVPVGAGGADIVFGDGVRSLVLDTGAGAIRLGGQLLTTSAAAIGAPAGPAVATGAASASVGSQLLVNAGAAVTATGTATVFGTIAGAEAVTVAPGAQLAFDGSFNAGGDRVVLAGAAAAWTAARSGATVVLAGPAGESVSIPTGPTAMTLQFADGSRTLLLDPAAAAIRIGGVAIGATPAPLAAPAAASADSVVASHAFAHDAPVVTEALAPSDATQAGDAGLLPLIA